MSASTAKAITREVNRLGNEVRQQAGGIVDAFGILDRVLASRLAFGTRWPAAIRATQPPLWPRGSAGASP